MVAASRSPRVVLTCFLALGLIGSACSSRDAGDDPATSRVEQPAKAPGDKSDCFPSCKQADRIDPTDANCKKLVDDLKVNNPSGWDPKLPTCIGFKDDIKDKAGCNKLVDYPNWTDCVNQEMLECTRGKKPGFGPVKLTPPAGGFPAPRDPPSVTDEEQACITQWKCPTAKTKSFTVALDFGDGGFTDAAADAAPDLDASLGDAGSPPDASPDDASPDDGSPPDASPDDAGDDACADGTCGDAGCMEVLQDDTVQTDAAALVARPSARPVM